MRLRTLALLLAGFSLLLIWYCVGRYSIIHSQNAVRGASAGGWDISPANRWGWDNSRWLLPILLAGGMLSLVGSTWSLTAPNLTRLRTLALLLVGFSLLLIWYYVGGREAIQWENAVRGTPAGGWDISQADRWGRENSHWFLPIFLVGGTLSLMAGRLLKNGVQLTGKDRQ
jgi:hypothetical protein